MVMKLDSFAMQNSELGQVLKLDSFAMQNSVLGQVKSVDLLCWQRRQQAEAEHGHSAGGGPALPAAGRALRWSGPRRQAPAVDRAVTGASQRQDPGSHLSQVSLTFHRSVSPLTGQSLITSHRYSLTSHRLVFNYLSQVQSHLSHVSL